TVRGADGAALAQLKSVAEEPPFLPKVELTKVTVPAGELNAAIVRPRAFDPAKRYPVIVSVYGGPRARMVSANSYAYVLPQWLADHGFIVVSIDGRGTPDRGRAFERALRG